MGVFRLLRYAYANMGWALRILSNKASEKDLHQGKWGGGGSGNWECWKVFHFEQPLDYLGLQIVILERELSQKKNKINLTSEKDMDHRPRQKIMWLFFSLATKKYIFLNS